MLVEDQFGSCVIGHGGVSQAFPAATIEAIGLSRKRSDRSIVKDKRTMVAADGTQTCSCCRFDILGGAENRNFVEGVFRDSASCEVEERAIHNIAAAILHHDFAFVT